MRPMSTLKSIPALTFDKVRPIPAVRVHKVRDVVILKLHLHFIDFWQPPEKII